MFGHKYPYTDFHEMNLDWVIMKMKECIEKVENIEGWKEQHEAEYQQMKRMYEALVAGQLPAGMVNTILKLIEDNAYDLIGKFVKMVFFGLTDAGYFVAYIPDGWQDITFNTSNYDYTLPDEEFGRLILSY